MAACLYDRLVAEDEYRQRIRRHRPSSLLPLIAAAAARYSTPERPQSWLESASLKYTPWALADAARVCLAYCTEHQRSEATERDLLEILAAYSSLQEPTLHGTDESAVRLRNFMMRLGGEQMAWQTPEFVSLARTAALHLHSTGRPSRARIGPIAGSSKIVRYLLTPRPPAVLVAIKVAYFSAPSRYR